MGWLDDFVARSHDLLDDRVRECLWARGVSDAQISSYRLGYVDRDLPSGLPDDFLAWSDGGAKLKDSFVLPLTNPLGETLGVQFRAVDHEVKGYVDYFLHRSEPILFGYGQAAPFIWETRTVVLVEGAFDLFPVQRALPNVVATITAKVPGAFLRHLRRLVDSVFLVYDADTTGIKGHTDFVKEHGSEFGIRVFEYPPGLKRPNGKPVKDPSDLWEVWGDDRLVPFIKSQFF